jgi:cell division control protein 45
MKFQNYYRGYFFGSSTSSVLYELCKQIDRESRDFLWLWIIGLSDIMIHCKQGELQLSDELFKCKEEVNRLHPSKQNKDFIEAGDIPQKDGRVDYQNAFLLELITRETSNLDVGTIQTESELKFMLLRHWSLFESIYNSNYMVTKLTLWKEQNQKRFREFLAKIAVPIEQAQQKYEFMNSSLKKGLKRAILDKAHEFELFDVT